MTEEAFESVAAWYGWLAGTLEREAGHAGVAANIPRGCAHAFAAQGYLREARNALDDLTVLHASNPRPES